jgi:hypothetical protein
MRHVLALIYYDILEFHRRTYAFFHRKGLILCSISYHSSLICNIAAWKTLFDTLWKDFGSRFSGIIGRLVRHRDLIDQEATSIDITEARSWRIRAQEELEDREREKSTQQLNRTINWLVGESSIHMPEDDLYRLSAARLKGTCKWILREKVIMNWLKDDEHNPAVWMRGIPGAGTFCVSQLDQVLNVGQLTLTSRQDHPIREKRTCGERHCTIYSSKPIGTPSSLAQFFD